MRTCACFRQHSASRIPNTSSVLQVTTAATIRLMRATKASVTPITRSSPKSNPMSLREKKNIGRCTAVWESIMCRPWQHSLWHWKMQLCTLVIMYVRYMDRSSSCWSKYLVLGCSSSHLVVLEHQHLLAGSANARNWARLRPCPSLALDPVAKAA